ncbi:hypothetical protein P280DRAFT_390394 [Massarina eburnea CBS 473.64]|uniref:non-specific serine/threonine protein kinase n=1 Tax=Massarina eburnea CBS 473.64 TaxID=1395130 RepID=A0A6A6SBT8_9PLEO|nr:hypothetical protein P280DRAFT_390394 [Massarina eburnea CBS 473.64]
MARRGGSSTQRQALQSVPNENLPPQSTIPAQIIQNATSANARRSTANKPPFIEQVREFLRKPNLEDSDDVCIAFAVTITNGGIDPLLNVDPFGRSQLEEQGDVCLAGLKIIFQQKPRLLLAYEQAKEDDTSPRPPIFVWLLPKLLGLLAQDDVVSIHTSVTELLCICFDALSQSKDATHRAGAVLQMYRSCVLYASDIDDGTDNLLSASFNLTLPTSSSIGDFWTESQHLVALPQGLQRKVRSAFQALYISFRLLIVMFPSNPKLSAESIMPSREHMQPWALDSAVTLWQNLKGWATISENVTFRVELEAMYIQLLETLSLPNPEVEEDFSCSPKSASLFMFALLELIQSCSASPLAEPNQIRLASLFNRLRSIFETLADNEHKSRRLSRLEHLIRDFMEPSVANFCQQVTNFTVLHENLQLALCLWTSPGDWPSEVEEQRARLCVDASKKSSSEELNQDFFSMSVVRTFRQMNIVEQEPPAKRRRTLPEVEENECFNMYEQLVMTLNGSTSESPVLNLSNLHQIVQATYLNLPKNQRESDKEQCELLSAFGKIACAGSQCLQSSSSSSHWMSSSCVVCDSTESTRNVLSKYWDTDDSNEAWQDVIAALIAIIDQQHFKQSVRSRIRMAMAIGRVFNHISTGGYLDVQQSLLGKFLLESMNKSIREMRIAASRSLMSFLREDVPKKTRKGNRVYTLQFLAQLTERNKPDIQETVIIHYGQRARLCGGVELELALSQLLDNLGHPNPYICDTAYNELASLADDLGMSPKDMFQPYWRTIGFSIVDQLLSKPQKADLVCELIGSSREQFLGETHGDVIAHLVLDKRKDILKKIADARRTSVGDICLQPRQHLARILALLLCQKGDNVETRAQEALAAVDKQFKLYDLVHLEPALVACEVLKMAADHKDDHKEPYHAGFFRVATLNVVGSNPRNKNAGLAPNDALEVFIGDHVLGVMTEFSRVIENFTGNQLLTEQKRCVGALEELISLAGESCFYALPQLRACLQSAMASIDLSNEAFNVWISLLWTLGTEHLKTMIDQSFALIVHNWPLFSEKSQKRAVEALENLRMTHNATLQERIAYIPSLASIPVFTKLEAEMARLRAKIDPVVLFGILSQRCNDENAVVVRQALKELIPFLEKNQKLLHESSMGQKPLDVLVALSRSLLDVCVRFAGKDLDIPRWCAQCLGLIGGLDPHRMETVREKKPILVLSNFQVKLEVINFAAFMLENVLVDVFLTTTNPAAQGFLAYLMQEICKACEFHKEAMAPTQRYRYSQSEASQRWEQLPEPVRTTITPFLSSRYVFKPLPYNINVQYPYFNLQISHGTWLRHFAYDLLSKAKESNAQLIFTNIAGVLRRVDLSISSFILPFAALSAILDGDESEASAITQELLHVLNADLQAADQTEASNIKQCSENVFQVIDYLSLWLHEKHKDMTEKRAVAGKTGRGLSESDEINFLTHVSKVEAVLQKIPAKVISTRAVECGSYNRALFHWEKHYREEQSKTEMSNGYFPKDDLLQHLQFIYAQIDEPDSVEGISAHLQVLNTEQQIMEHRKAGRWTAAQSWYELALAERPNDPETQINLLTCLKESGQYDAILNYVDGFHASDSLVPSTLPFAAEAAWSSGKYDQLEKILAMSPDRPMTTSMDFNIGVGKALLAMRYKTTGTFKQTIEDMRGALAKSMTPTATASLHASHDQLVKLHTLYELEAISGMSAYTTKNHQVVLDNLDRRLDILGAYTSDKQYLLGVRRASMQLSNIGFTNLDVASAWLTTARLLRKGDFTPAAFNAILHATQLGDDASKIEYSKMLWKEGHHRKAIQNIRGAIKSNSFQTKDLEPMNISVSVSTTGLPTTNDGPQPPNRVKAHAQLLLAKWLDRAGQTQSVILKEEYSRGIMTFPKWDKGHYYLGRYYLKLYETEKLLPPAKQAQNFLAGELAKLVVENFTRSTVYGAKHYYQTIPKLITLWLDMGTEVINSQPRLPRDKELHQHKLNHLDSINKYIKRYANERMPAYPWYTALPQIITRISHPEKSVWEVLSHIILKVAGQYPQQALWSLFALLHSTQDNRRSRGTLILQKLRDHGKRKSNSYDLKALILQGQRLTDALLAACDAHIEPRIAHVSLSRDLGFKMSLVPCALVVPIEATMSATLPSSNESKAIRAHNPFPSETITISAFKDDVFVLSSLQRPRKLVAIGSDGKSYGLMCKPKDDLRKDQRLMEFNAMINRAFQRDTESTKRRLYIRTYGVTPLNEECGAIEWVEGLKPLRDIIIRLYRQKSIAIDYGEIRLLLNEASSSPSKTPIFTQKILKKFPAVLHEWFLETFPEPEAWFAARLRYIRSCAVMSIVGHVLGLGDRHGENILLEQGNGGTFHVDFNCLFDKGLTFEKPELVPFRLTHNMVDAMGPSGVEGPFRSTCEITYSLLRQHLDTLITILETFVHDPTTDFVGQKRKKRIAGVPETPREVLEMVRGKVEGEIRGESLKLSVEGYVEWLVAMARSPEKLAGMYIGWCAFF